MLKIFGKIAPILIILSIMSLPLWAGTLPNVEIKDNNGAPEIYVDGIPRGPMIFTDHGDTPDTYLKNLNTDGFEIIGLVYYTANGGQPLSYIDTRVNAILKQNPNAYILLRVELRIPTGWNTQHPTEMAVFSDITQTSDMYSLASEVWKSDMATLLTSIVTHVKGAGYSDHVIGYQIGAGATDEWGHWGWGVDRSPAMAAYFKSWVQNNYGNDLTKLRAAWHNNTITFDTVTLPTTAEETPTYSYACIDIRTSQKIVDYYKACNDTVAEKIIYFSKLIKDAYSGKIITQALYGGFCETNYTSSGTSSVKMILNSPYVDSLGSAPTYENRDLGNNTTFRSVTDSFKLHNKIYCLEADTRTVLNPPAAVQFGRPDTMAGTLNLINRDFGTTLIKGAAGYWFGGYQTFNAPEIHTDFALTQKIGKLSTKLDKTCLGEIAVIVDEDSIYITPTWTSYYQLNTNFIHEFGRAGTQIDVYHMDDLINGKVPDHKLYIFPNLFYVNNQKLAALNTYVKKNNKVALFNYFPGIMNTDRVSIYDVNNMVELTGIKLSLISGSPLLAMKVTNSNFPGLAVGDILGNLDYPVDTGFAVLPPDFKPHNYAPEAADPHCYVTDTNVTVIARSTVNNQPMLAVKDMGTWKSVYMASRAINGEAIRAIARYAGVNIFDDTDDIVQASKNLLMVHTKIGGLRTLRFKNKTSVYDLIDDKLVAVNTSALKVNIPDYTTKIYYYGDINNFRKVYK